MAASNMRDSSDRVRKRTRRSRGFALDYHQKFYWKQFASEVERSAAGQVPDWRPPEFIAWASERGILESTAGKNAGKESVPAG